MRAAKVVAATLSMAVLGAVGIVTYSAEKSTVANYDRLQAK
jgi:hypothetical protein